MYSYPIDYSQFTTEEIVVIVEFLALIEDANTRRIDLNLLSVKHKKFREVVNSKALEKQIDRAFEKTSGYSIYKTIKQYMG
jgi:uncharacterized protein YktA (UPF0223 family)